MDQARILACMSRAIQENKSPTVSDAPASRPLRLMAAKPLLSRLEAAIAAADGITGAHCIHELWMRGELAVNIENALERLWGAAAASIPDWLPMRHIDWLPLAYEVAARFEVALIKSTAKVIEMRILFTGVMSSCD